MPAATEAVLNMSQALGQDLKSSSVQLGKALNDPIKGITALSRVGVSFTDEQKEQIKTMQESGDMMGAQGVILAELDKEFGGAAKAAGQTFGGQMVILQTAVGNVAEAIGGPLVKGLSTLATAALPAVNAFADQLPAAIDGFMGSLSGMGDVLAPIITILTDGWNTVMEVFAGDWSASDQIDPVVNLIGQLASFVRDDLIPPLLILGDVVTSVFAGDFKMAGMTLVDVIDTWGPVLVGALAGMAQAFLSWIGPMIPPLLQQLLALLIQIDTWIISTGLPMLVTQLAVWAGAFVDWVAPLIPPLLVELGGLLAQLGSWMLTVAAPAMIANLATWGLAFVEWVAPRIPLLMAECLKLELALGVWILTQALPGIVAKLVEWGNAFVDWVAKDVLPTLPEKLGAILSGIATWVDGAITDVAATATDIGLALLAGIQKGISDDIARFRTWIETNIGLAIPDWVKSALGIQSPSTVMAKIGFDVTAGLAQGIKQGSGIVGGAVNDVVQTIVNQALKVGIDPLIALALAKAESGLNASAVGDNGHSVGLFQLHDQGQGAGLSVAARQNAETNATVFLTKAHADLFKQLVAEGLVGDQLAATFGRLAEGSDPQFAQRYAAAYREIVAQFGPTIAASGALTATTTTLSAAQQQGVSWAQKMAEQQQALTNTLSQQAPPMRASTDAMAAFGAVLGPIERQTASGAIGLSTLQFKLVDLARATGLATQPWADYDAGLIDIDQALERVINQSADAGPQFEALRQQQDDAGRSTRQNALDFLQLALNYQAAKPAIDAVAAATGVTATQTGDATDAVGDLTGKFQALQPVIASSTDLVKAFQKSVDALDIGKVDDMAGSWDGVAGKINDATNKLQDFIKTLQDAPSGGVPGFASGGTFARGGLAMVGERGPELLALPGGSHITSNNQLRSMGSGGDGGGDTYITVNVPGLVGTIDQVTEALHTGLLRKRRRTGPLGLA